VNQILGWEVDLQDFTIRAATPGKDAVGEVTLRAQIEGKTVTGRGASTDIVDAAVRAYLHALNKVAHAQQIESAAPGAETRGV
jgi:2-isopropylmalate synthase